MLDRFELVDFLTAKCKETMSDVVIHKALISEHAEKVKNATGLFEAISAIAEYNAAFEEFDKDVTYRTGKLDAYNEIFQKLGFKTLSEDDIN